MVAAPSFFIKSSGGSWNDSSNLNDPKYILNELEVVNGSKKILVEQIVNKSEVLIAKLDFIECTNKQSLKVNISTVD